MVVVTKQQYYIDDALKSKLDLMVKRMKGTDDNIITIDGDEGQGKTEFACGICNYIAEETGREYNVKHIFFDIEKLIQFAATTKDQVLHFDEAVLGLMSTQWQNKLQQKFLQLVMTARKKRHFIVLCIPKFNKLASYVIDDRCIGLVHVYSRKNLYKGRFYYYTKRKKAALYEAWKKTGFKKYKKFYALRGSFVQAMKKVFTPEEMEEYERKKDKAIASILNPNNNVVPNSIKVKVEKDFKQELYKKLKEKFPDYTQQQYADVLCVSLRTISSYEQVQREQMKALLAKNPQ